MAMEVRFVDSYTDEKILHSFTGISGNIASNQRTPQSQTDMIRFVISFFS